MLKSMKYLTTSFVICLIIIYNIISAEPEIEHINIDKLRLNRYFGDGIQRILIIPEVNTYKGELVLMGAGSGVIAGEDIIKIQNELSTNVLELVAPMHNYELFQIYVFYNNNKFDANQQILTCQINDNKINLIIKNGNDLLHLRLPTELSKLFISKIARKAF
jgi:hypothetical protein